MHHVMGSSHITFLRFPAVGGNHCPPSDSEFGDTTHLTFRDVAVDRLQAPSMLRVRIKASKTDPFRVGVYVVVGKVDGPVVPCFSSSIGIPSDQRSRARSTLSL